MIYIINAISSRYRKITIICFLLIISLLISESAFSQNLADFGYNSLKIDEVKSAKGKRPFVIVLINSRDSDAPRYQGNAKNIYRNKFLRGRHSIQNFFRNASNNIFSWESKGVWGVYQAKKGRCFPSKGQVGVGRSMLRKEAVHALLSDPNFNPKAYDVNHDNKLSEKELGILVLYSCTRKKGA